MNFLQFCEGNFFGHMAMDQIITMEITPEAKAYFVQAKRERARLNVIFSTVVAKAFPKMAELSCGLSSHKMNAAQVMPGAPACMGGE